MSKTIKNVEQMYDLLVECREVFKDLGGDTITEVSKMERLCNRIDNLLELKKNDANAYIEVDKEYWS